MEEFFKIIAGHIALALEVISVTFVVLGALQATIGTLRQMFSGNTAEDLRRAAWLSMARWLLLALEFMLAADIVRTAITPDWTAIGQLGAIAAIRTFLNYFLERDIDASPPGSAAAPNA